MSKRVVTSRYPIPKNFKRGSLIGGKYRKSDMTAIILSAIWVFALIIVYSFVFVWDVYSLVFMIVPPLVVYILTMPDAYHHNFLEYQKTRIRYFIRDKRFFNVVDIRKDNDYEKNKKD